MSSQARSVTATREDSVLESFASQGGGVLLSRVVAFIGTAYLARTLGTYAFGIVGFATAITMFLALALRSGFEPVGAREVARDSEAAGPLAAGVGLLRLALAALALLLLGLAAMVLPKPPEVRLVLFLSGLTLVPLAMDPRWVYRGLARNRRVGISLVLAQAVYVVLLLLLVRGPAQVYWVPLALAIGELTAVAYLVRPLMRGWNRSIAGGRAWQVFRASGFLVSSDLLGALVRTTDIVLIAFLLGEAAVGLYSAAYRICFLIMGLAVALHWTYLPRLAKVPRADGAGHKDVLDRALEAGSSLAIPCVVGGWILAEPLLGGLFGDEYSAGTWAFRFLLLAMGLYFHHGFLFQVLVVHDRTRPELAIRALAAALSLSLNLLLIPRLGIAGAGLATVAAELVILVGRWIVCHHLGLRIGWRSIGKPLLAAAAMGAAMWWLLPRLPWPVVFVSGGAVYVALLFALRGLPRDLLPRRSAS